MPGGCGTTRVCVVQRFSLMDKQERRSGSGRLFLEPQKNCATSAASFLMSVQEREPPYNNAHARSATTTWRLPYVYIPHVTFQTRPSPLLTVHMCNDNAAYNAHVSGEAWERGYAQIIRTCIPTLYYIFCISDKFLDCSGVYKLYWDVLTRLLRTIFVSC